ncbi:MAG: hypothetical protein H6839_12710 [Planctomycetes bacterium]|nr:hypothetical protein [Planctomycetota bacterium]
MTAQAPDRVLYLNKNFVLAGISEDELWSPEARFTDREALCTGCYRGYIATYRVHDDALELHELKLSHGQSSMRKPPPLGGREPTPFDQEPFGFFNWTYTDIGMRLDYSGGLLLADGFIQKLYVHMGFHPAWKYKHVHELVFDNGRLVDAFDRSRQMVEIRKEFKNKPLKPSRELDSETIRSWIEGTFSRKYER